MQKPLRDFFSQNHHAFCVEGGNAGDVFAAVCAQWDLSRTSSDIWMREMSTFSVADAQQLRAFTARAAGSGTKAAIISCTDMTREAQNALLKTVEEPRGNTKIIFVIPYADRLIPTIRSRVVHIHISETEKGSGSRQKIADEFFSAVPAERLKIAETLIERKDKREIISFLNILQKHAYEKNDTRALSALNTVQTYISDRGASAKLLLEYLALAG